MGYNSSSASSILKSSQFSPDLFNIIKSKSNTFLAFKQKAVNSQYAVFLIIKM